MLDANPRRILWISEGCSRASVRPFFEELGLEGGARIEAVVMDMNIAFDPEVCCHHPTARVVCDLSHVVAKYGRELLDRVRIDEANRMHHDNRACKIIMQA
ncbi:transposase [Pseudomonas sp.]|uniref:transposase n=1 Tax=Pseudomonas sp. TaxID=306 RepID=UPI00260EA2A1|nr:transposase [Pseudomonas sp.]MDP9058492.1 transposase [Pseudomonadota bacterium]MDP9215295.1 transposase [Pseudomonadota bacterium]MDP9448202.1 transposase [Pseudomonadota bacterium]